jgi:hypothetical protein
MANGMMVRAIGRGRMPGLPAALVNPFAGYYEGATEIVMPETRQKLRLDLSHVCPPLECRLVQFTLS